MTAQESTDARSLQETSTNPSEFRQGWRALLLAGVCCLLWAVAGCGFHLNGNGGDSVLRVPASLSFGSVPVGQSTSSTVTVINTSRDAVTISQLTIAGQVFWVSAPDNPPVKIAGNSAYKFQVGFRPTTTEAFSGRLTIQTREPIPPAAISISGTGTKSASSSLQVNPGSVSFGPVALGGSASQSVTLTALGTPVTVNSVSIDGAQFSLTGPAFSPATLNPGQSLTLQVQYNPATAGAASGTLTVVSDAASNGTATVPLSGSGVENTVPHLTVAPGSIDFGSVTAGSSATQNLTLTASGTAPVTVTSASVSGAGFTIQGQSFPLTLQPNQQASIQVGFAPSATGSVSGAITLASNAVEGSITVGLNGSGASSPTPQLTITPGAVNFGDVTAGNASSPQSITLLSSGSAPVTISSAAVSGAGFALSGQSFPLTLAPNQKATVSVTFQPAQAGASSGQVVFSSNAGGGSNSVALSGNGVDAATPQLSVTPGNLDFGNVIVGSSQTESITLTASGAPVTVSSTAINGAGFTITSGYSGTLNPGQSAAIQIAFNPSATGAVSGQVTVNSNAGNPSITVGLQGAGTSAPTPALSVNSGSLNFGNVAVGSSASLNLTLTSTGGAPLSVSSVTLAGTGFAIGAGSYPVTLNPGQQTVIPVTFNPSSAGGATGTILINTNSAAAPVVKVSLSGTGQAANPQLSVSPGSLGFGNVTVSSSIVQTLTLTSTGSSPVTVNSAAVTAGQSQGFSILGNSFPVTLNPNQQATIQVQFYPLTAGAAAGQIAISSNATGGGSITVSLTGTGKAAGTDPTGTPVTQCQPFTRSGQYYLANDVTCTSTAFAVATDNVSFNLNGHTVTYGNTGSAVVPAFSGCDGWETGGDWQVSLGSSACQGSSHNNFEVYGGSVVQTPGSAPFSPVVLIGQANASAGWKIHDLTMTFQETGTQAVFGDYAGDGAQIYNNVINDNVTNIQHPGQPPLGARSHFQGYVINMSGGAPYNENDPGDRIYGNTINGSPQGGIFDYRPNTQIYSNTITLSSRYSNDYGVIITADGQQVHDNIIQGRGRGLDAESSNYVIDHNTINVHEEPNNSEYGGCELRGSDGIRLKNYIINDSADPYNSANWNQSKGGKITNNTVTVSAATCDAHALRFTDLYTNVQLTITGNTFTTIPGQGNDFAFSVSGVNQPQVTFANNSFSGGICAQIDNDGTTDGANILVQSGQTWSCSKATVIDSDLAADDSGRPPYAYPEAMTIQDSVPNPSVLCGPYALGKIKIGSYTKVCGQ